MTKMQSQSTSCPTSISLKAATEALNGDKACLETMRKEFEKRTATGYVCPIPKEAIAEALHLLLTDEAERKRRGEAGYEYAMEHFRPEVLTRQMVELYGRVIDER